MRYYFRPAIRIKAIGNYNEILQSSLNIHDEKGNTNQRSKSDGDLESFDEVNETYFQQQCMGVA